MRVGVDMGITHVLAKPAFRYVHVVSLKFYVVGIVQYSEIGHWQV